MSSLWQIFNRPNEILDPAETIASVIVSPWKKRKLKKKNLKKGSWQKRQRPEKGRQKKQRKNKFFSEVEYLVFTCGSGKSGMQYALTRHNVGFGHDEITSRAKVSLKRYAASLI